VSDAEQLSLTNPAWIGSSTTPGEGDLRLAPGGKDHAESGVAQERLRIGGGSYRRDHLRGLAQRVEIADKEGRIVRSKRDLLRTLVAGPGVTPVTRGIRSSVLNWRAAPDDDGQYIYAIAL